MKTKYALAIDYEYEEFAVIVLFEENAEEELSYMYAYLCKDRDASANFSKYFTQWI